MKNFPPTLVLMVFVCQSTLADPVRVTDLAVTNIGSVGLCVSWTVPPGALTNDLRLSTNSAINVQNWSYKERLDYANEPGTPGTIRSVTVVDLSPNTNYYLALKVWTTNGVWSIISNQEKVRTGGAFAEAILAWDLPQTNINGSVLTDLANIKLYMGESSGSRTFCTNVGLSTHTTIHGLEYGRTYYFDLTACSSSGVESVYSEELVWISPLDYSSE